LQEQELSQLRSDVIKLQTQYDAAQVDVRGKEEQIQQLLREMKILVGPIQFHKLKYFNLLLRRRDATVLSKEQTWCRGHKTNLPFCRTPCETLLTLFCKMLKTRTPMLLHNQQVIFIFLFSLCSHLGILFHSLNAFIIS